MSPDPEVHGRPLTRPYRDAPGSGVDRTMPGAQADLAAQQAALAATADNDQPDATWIRRCLEQAYRLPVTQPQAALMPALKPLQRQHMTPRVLHRSLGRQLLGLFVYRPAARFLRGLQIFGRGVKRQ